MTVMALVTEEETKLQIGTQRLKLQIEDPAPCPRMFQMHFQKWRRPNHFSLIFFSFSY